MAHARREIRHKFVYASAAAQIIATLKDVDVWGVVVNLSKVMEDRFVKDICNGVAVQLQPVRLHGDESIPDVILRVSPNRG